MNELPEFAATEPNAPKVWPIVSATPSTSAARRHGGQPLGDAPTHQPVSFVSSRGSERQIRISPSTSRASAGITTRTIRPGQLPMPATA